MLRNTIYVGSIKDNDNVWHPVVCSPDEDYVQRYCTRITDIILDDDETENFYTSIYTVEIIPIIMTDEMLNKELDDEDWMQWSSWNETDESEFIDYVQE